MRSASSEVASGSPMTHRPTRFQEATALLHQGAALLCRSKIPTQSPSRQASPPRGEHNLGTRTRPIELRCPRSLQRNRQNTWREEEKSEATRRVAMAERTIPILNDYFCRKLWRKERHSMIVAWLSALKARIILSRYLRIPPPSFHAQKPYLMSSGRVLNLRHQASKPLKLQAQGTHEKNKRHPPWRNFHIHLWMRSQAVGQESPPPRGKTPKAHRRLTTLWRLKRSSC